MGLSNTGSWYNREVVLRPYGGERLQKQANSE